MFMFGVDVLFSININQLIQTQFFKCNFRDLPVFQRGSGRGAFQKEDEAFKAW